MALRALQFELVAQARGNRGAWRCQLDQRFSGSGEALGAGLVETCVNWPESLGEFPTPAELDAAQLDAHKVLYLARAAGDAAAETFEANGEQFDLAAPGVALALLADCPARVTIPTAAGGFEEVDRNAFLALVGAHYRERFRRLARLARHAAGAGTLEELNRYDFGNPPPV